MSVLPLLGKVPLVMQAHGTLFGEIRSKLRTGHILSMASSLKNLMVLPRDLLFYRRLKTVVAVGPVVYNTLRHPLIRLVLPENRIIMIPNGVDTELFKPDSGEKEKIRSQLSIPQNVKVLVWASRLHRQKGAHLALEALARLNRDDVWFLVIGDGPEKKKLQQQADELGILDHVIFTGEVPHDCLPSFLSAGDTFIFTTIRDEVGLPLNLLEAMALDLPCVISKHLSRSIDSIEDVKGIYFSVPTNTTDVTQGISEALYDNSKERRAFIEEHLTKFIEHVKGVYPVQPRNMSGIVEGISKALCDRSNGRRSFVEAYYSKKLMLSRYEDLLKKACST